MWHHTAFVFTVFTLVATNGNKFANRLNMKLYVPL